MFTKCLVRIYMYLSRYQVKYLKTSLADTRWKIHITDMDIVNPELQQLCYQHPAPRGTY